MNLWEVWKESSSAQNWKAPLPRGRDPSKGSLPGTGDVPLFRDVQQSVNSYIIKSFFGNKAQLEVISPICCLKNR